MRAHKREPRSAGQAAIELRAKREADGHKVDLLRLRKLRNAKGGFRPDRIVDVPVGMGFVAKPPALLRSTVWRSLGIYERRMLDALEVEHCAHGGKENGYLVLTYDEAVRWGIPRRSFRATVAKLIRKGLLEITHQGSYRGGAQLDPNRYRLTYLRFVLKSGVGGTQYFAAGHDWVDVELAVIEGRGPPLHIKRHTAPKSGLSSIKYDTSQVVKYDTALATTG